MKPHEGDLPLAPLYIPPLPMDNHAILTPLEIPDQQTKHMDSSSTTVEQC